MFERKKRYWKWAQNSCLLRVKDKKAADGSGVQEMNASSGVDRTNTKV